VTRKLLTLDRALEPALPALLTLLDVSADGGSSHDNINLERGQLGRKSREPLELPLGISESLESPCFSTSPMPGSTRCTG
jgi:hypothetical protein